MGSGELYEVERDGQLSSRLATREQVEGFIDACAIRRESPTWHAALQGTPIRVDGGEIKFTLKKSIRLS